MNASTGITKFHGLDTEPLPRPDGAPLGCQVYTDMATDTKCSNKPRRMLTMDRYTAEPATYPWPLGGRVICDEHLISFAQWSGIDPEEGPEVERTATLMLSPTHGATCCACGQAAGTFAQTHNDGADSKGCGATFVRVSPHYSDIDAWVMDLRPDLIFMTNPTAVTLAEGRRLIDESRREVATDMAYSIGLEFDMDEWDIDRSAAIINVLEKFSYTHPRAARQLFDDLVAARES